MIAIKSTHMKNFILFLTLLGTARPTQAQVQFEPLNVNYSQGLGEMKDLGFVGVSAEFGYSLKETPFTINAFYSGGDFQWRMEYLPIQTETSGFSEEVRVRSRGAIKTMGLRLRYSPEMFNTTRFLPYGEVGIGHARYSQNWDSRGEQTVNPTDACPKYQHHEHGRVHLGSTFFGSAELGLLFRYNKKRQDEDYNGKGAFFGFSVRYELGGRVSYADPHAHAEHFYYDSGLGQSADRPFTVASENLGRSMTKTARHQHLIYKISFLRLVL